ncbi:hypothetical protein HPP92_003613 [Vanilla planifolia]|uniref:Uncharacterized protein n=1 Tax=Vanilla planifolia TaxID=51239 RepID=A0A835VHD5_VANPL|nr:hypothetical protein HPP92_003613 [Vanilla planifolia]
MVLAQTAAAPGPSGPLNITAAREGSGAVQQTLIRLMKSTQIADQINNQLNNPTVASQSLHQPIMPSPTSRPELSTPHGSAEGRLDTVPHHSFCHHNTTVPNCE